MQTPSSTISKSILFFDGHCHLCNGLVDWMISRDSELRIHFAPLQGETARNLLTREQCESVDRVLFLHQSEILEKSSAILTALSLIPGWKWAHRAQLIPEALRDAVYLIVAKNRYRWFPRSETCRLPQPGEASRFLP